ncbi:MAG: adenosylcobinamide-GDP ribazoletransferase [Myxococcota bacterium]
MKRLVAHELIVFALAVQFLTRFPVPLGDAYTPARLAAAPRYYPLVGVLIGAICAAIYWLARPLLTDPVAVILATAAGVLATGAFHEDGLADTFDGIGAGSREKALEAMRDSRLGTYGTLALGLTVAMKIGALLALPSERALAAWVVAHGLSRLSSVSVIATSRYVREEGVGKPTADGIGYAGLTIALTTGGALLVWLVWLEGLGAAICAAGGALLGQLFMRWMFERRLGGYTGDTLGAVQQTSELGVYLGLLVSR